MQRGAIVVVLLCGGDKSTQPKTLKRRRNWPRSGRIVHMNDDIFSRYDASDYLKSEADIAAYLDAVMEEGGDDPAFVAMALGDVARARNMSQLARDTGISREGLSKALSGDGNPTLATILKVSKALGLKLSFQPAG